MRLLRPERRKRPFCTYDYCIITDNYLQIHRNSRFFHRAPTASTWFQSVHLSPACLQVDATISPLGHDSRTNISTFFREHLYESSSCPSAATAPERFAMPQPFKPLTYTDVAEVLGCSERHVRDLIDRGELIAPKRLGQQALWHPDVFWGWFDTFLREQAPPLPKEESGGNAREFEITPSTNMPKKPVSGSPALRRAAALTS